jgi:hypothetical protein
MFTVITFFISGVLAWTHLNFVSWQVYGSITVWRAWFAATLIACVVEAAKSNNKSLQACACMMVISFLISLISWSSSNVIWPENAFRFSALILGLTAVLVTSQPERRTDFAIIGCIISHFIIIMAAFATYEMHIIADHISRIKNHKSPLIAFTFPDISAGLQYVCLLLIGISSNGKATPMVFSDRYERVLSLSGIQKNKK